MTAVRAQVLVLFRYKTMLQCILGTNLVTTARTHTQSFSAIKHTHCLQVTASCIRQQNMPITARKSAIISFKHSKHVARMMTEIIISAVLVVAGLVLLCFGGNWLVGGGEKIAKRFHISSFVIGMTVVAYGTSTPELAASIAASGEHNAIILGNIVGSNIANIGMVIGISAVLLPLAVDKSVLRKEIPIMLGASLLLVVLSADGEISQYDGSILLVGLCLVAVRTIRIIKGQRADSFVGTVADADVTAGASDAASTKEDSTSLIKTQSSGKFYAKNAGMIGAGIVLLYAGAILTVDHAVILAQAFGLSQKVIGLTVVAIGTSLPELVTSVMAIRKGKEDIGVGNIIGSNIYNVLMIMGVGAALGGVVISQDVYLDYGIMLAFSAVLLIALKTRVISKKIGICLAIGYAAYLGMSLLK